MGAYKNGPRKCEIPGCDRKHSGHGMCKKHYSRWYRHRDLGRDRQAYWTELFWSHVDKSGDCWLWTGHLINGYGRTRVSGRVKGAHALSYELTVGPVPEGLVLDHMCHNNDLSCAGGSDCLHRRCVNPAHLRNVRKVEDLRMAEIGQLSNTINTLRSYAEARSKSTSEAVRLTAEGVLQILDREAADA